MTETARIYGGSLYDLAAEENLTGEILGQMEQIRTLLWENPEYERLLSEPSIPQMERNGMIEAAFGGQAQRYLVNFMKLMCEKNLLGNIPAVSRLSKADIMKIIISLRRL